MAFRKNESQQISIFDCYFNLTEREEKALEGSWAKVFAEEIFPYIEEELFRPIYSENDGSRPNTPVNILFGANILKERFGASDDEMVENMMLDIRYQYALHTTSYKEQPLSDKSLSRFRARCYDYEEKTGVDLINLAMTALSGRLALLDEIMPGLKRMDSLMIEANIKRMSRMELLYSCVARIVKLVMQNHKELISQEMQHYSEKDDYNKVIYHARGENVEERINTILEDGDKLLDLCKEKFAETSEYKLLVRCFSEQTKVNEGKRKLKGKEDGGMDSNILQNPVDPEATFRKKAGKNHVGYVANVEESVGENGSLITDYQVEKNNYSDSQFFKDSCERREKSEIPETVITDGAYGSDENTELAREKNLILVPTDLLGKDVPEIYADFKLNEEGTEVLSCPAGHKPKSCWFNPVTGQCEISMDISHCEKCPYRNQCPSKLKKRVAKLKISSKAVRRAKVQKSMKTEEFKKLSQTRNGVESIPSQLRNVFNIDKMRCHGKNRTALFFGFKVGALNFAKHLRIKRRLDKVRQISQNTVQMQPTC